MTEFRVETTVEWWNDASGCGALADCEEAPGGVFVHFSIVEMVGFKKLLPGQRVEALVSEGGQDGYSYAAGVVRQIA